MQAKKAILFLIICLLTISNAQTAMAGPLHNTSQKASNIFNSSFGQMEKIFPEKYDAILSTLYRPEDRILYIFREMVMSEYNQRLKVDSVLNGYLKKALNRYWLLESNEFKKTFQTDEKYYLSRLKRYLKKLPNTYDQAAFSFLFVALSEKSEAVVPFVKSSAEAMECLKDIKHQKAYQAAIEKSKDFYKKIPLFFKVANKIEDKIETFIDKLQQKFLLEKMILACDSLIPQKNGKIQSALTKLKSKLEERLLSKILSNLEIQLETGLETDAVTGIMKSTMGVMVSQTLYHGRIRTFIKEMQKSENIKQLNCYLQTMSRLKNNFSRLLNTNISPASKVTLNKMSKNFDEMKVIMKLKLRNATDESETYKSLTKLFEKEFVAQDYSCFLESF